MHIRLSQHEAAKHEHDQQHQRTQRIGHHQVASQGTDRAEQRDGHVVNKRAEKPEHKEPENALNGVRKLILGRGSEQQDECSLDEVAQKPDYGSEHSG